MLKFAERILRKTRNIEQETKERVLNGSVKDYQHYRFLMGRLEGISLVEEMIREEVSKLDDH